MGICMCVHADATPEESPHTRPHTHTHKQLGWHATNEDPGPFCFTCSFYTYYHQLHRYAIPTSPTFII